MATVLEFPGEYRLDRVCCDDLQLRASAAAPVKSLLTSVRSDVRQSLMLLDIAVFQLRRAMPEELSGQFSQDIAAIEQLLVAARREAQKI
jgi:hypothetical protein